jgi:hypothetical protein
MEEKTKAVNNNGRAIILGIAGVILFVLGILIVSVRGAPLRGSGAGTILIILGLILLVIAGIRAFYKRK